MSQIAYRGNLSSAYFPLISRFHGRTVIVPGQDNNFSRQLQSSADLDKDVGIPQVYYCHNIMPTGQGYLSIGYEQRVAAFDGTDKGITQEITMRDDNYNGGSKGYFMGSPNGFYYVLNETAGYAGFAGQYWDGAAMQNFPNIAGIQITRAHVNGKTYIYISGVGCFTWDFANQRFNLQVLTGLTASAIVGITESRGYMIAYSTNAVAWSSLIDPTDFTPSLQTGAGGGQVQSIKGVITCGAPTSNGFILYTAQNAVAVLYTNNAQYPFNFNECIGAGGISTLERVTFDSDSGNNYAYTSFGVQVIKAKSAETILADVTDFLAGQYFEDFNEATLAFEYSILTAPMHKKLTFVADRYLVISYGISSLTHALVYDSVQKRFGKLRVNHVACFQYDLLTDLVSDIPRKSIAFVASDGTISVVNFAAAFTNRSGVLLLGKYQYVRSRGLALQEATLENPTKGGKLKVYDFVSADGKNYSQKVAGTVLSSGDDTANYGFGSPDGKNHSILLVGCFNLNTVELAFNVTGRL
jgi:hypothetical protein